MLFIRQYRFPLHIGVLLFVMISGYFGIKTSIKGIIRLLGIVAVYYIPLQLINVYLQFGGGNVKEITKALLFISHTPYWFIRTYLCLFLLAPVINKYLECISSGSRKLLLISLCFISIYLGTSHGDPALADGKNMANFILLYVIGNTMRVYKGIWMKTKAKRLIFVYVLLNIGLVVSYIYFEKSIIGKAIWLLSYPYCSPILLLNAIIVFMILGKIRFSSTVINAMASSTLAIYLIHSHPLVLDYIGKLIPFIYGRSANIVSTLLLMVAYTLIIMLLSIGIDNTLKPVWTIINRYGYTIDKRYCLR